MSLRINMRLERLRSTLLQKIAVINEKMNSCHDRGDMEQGSALIKEREQLLADETGQKEYAKMILQIGNGSIMDSLQLNLFQSNPQAYSNTYNYKYEKRFFLDDQHLNESMKDFQKRLKLRKQDALNYFFPKGFQSHEMSKKAILAATNKQVDDWNSIIQQMNPNFKDDTLTEQNDNQYSSTKWKCHTYSSADKLCVVDDPKDIISQMLTDEMLNKFENEKAPPHKLTLCVGDICYLLRTMGRQTKLVFAISYSNFSKQILTTYILFLDLQRTREFAFWL